jgi:hexokinase
LFPKRKYDSYIGFILGTGTNTCYLEENSKILKISSLDPKGSMLINIESGGYNKFDEGIIDKEFDKNFGDTGQYTYEKMISGKYQGGLILAVIRKAVQYSLFSKYFSEKISHVSEINANEIDDFLNFPYSASKLSDCCTTEAPGDRITLYYLIDAIQDRAAKLVTVNLAAIIKMIGKGSDPCVPVCIAAEGSAFEKSKMFRGKLNFYIKQYINDDLGLYCEIVERKNSTLIGTAIVGLSS